MGAVAQATLATERTIAEPLRVPSRPAAVQNTNQASKIVSRPLPVHAFTQHRRADDRSKARGQKVNVGCRGPTSSTWAQSCPTHPDLERERVVVSADGEHFACIGTDRQASIWDCPTASHLKLLPETSVWDIAWSPCGATLVTGSGDGIARVWDGNSRILEHSLKGHSRGVTCVAWSPDGFTIATGSADATVRLWNRNSGTVKFVLKGHKDTVSSISWSPEGDAVATGSWDTDVRIWSSSTGAVLRVLDVENAKYEMPDANMAGAEEVHTWHDSWVWYVSWSPDGNTLAIAAEDCTVKLYNRRTGKVRRVLGGDFFFFFAAAWSPDGRFLATCSDIKKKSAKVWWTRRGTLSHALKGHTDLVTTLAFNPQGDLVVTGSHDGTAKLWASTTGYCIRTFEGHRGPVTSVAWHPNGREVYTASEDGTVRIYQVVHHE